MRSDTLSGHDSAVLGPDVEQLNAAARRHGKWIPKLKAEIAKTVVGQKRLIDRLLVAMLANGHVLLEGVPGLAKTLTLKTLAGAVDAKFRRIQFTPDMLPADVVGTEVYNPKNVSFEVKHGPLFSNFVLADEINRAPAKVQSALLEGMQERQVTIGEKTYPLDNPFLVMATQNPIEQQGTYPLPEAQVDRFLMKVIVDYPDPREERTMIDVVGLGAEPRVPEKILSVEDLLSAREAVTSVFMDDNVKDYIVSLVHATREPEHYGLRLAPYIAHGASPRATLGLVAASRAHAFLDGRGYVTPQDVKDVAMDVMAHRIGMTYVADAESIPSTQIVQTILDTISVP